MPYMYTCNSVDVLYFVHSIIIMVVIRQFDNMKLFMSNSSRSKEQLHRVVSKRYRRTAVDLGMAAIDDEAGVVTINLLHRKRKR